MESDGESRKIQPASGELTTRSGEGLQDSVQLAIGEDPLRRMMGPKQITEARWRADDKIRYARLMLKELGETSKEDRDFTRAHEEAFLFHLFGALDAFTEELNPESGIIMSGRSRN